MHIYVLKRLDVLVYHRLKLEYCAKGRGCVGASRYDAAPRPAATAIAVATTAAVAVPTVARRAQALQQRKGLERSTLRLLLRSPCAKNYVVLRKPESALERGKCGQAAVSAQLYVWDKATAAWASSSALARN